ncbi:MAG: DUF559 domain-containing protein [Armatimonadota bacterium]
MSEENPARKRLSKSPPTQIARSRRLRKKMSPPEVIIWQLLRPANNKDFTFRRQVPLLPGIIVDFYFARKKIAFEIDGKIHGLKQFSDATKDSRLREAGVTVVRISARKVFESSVGVANLIRMICLGEIELGDIESSGDKGTSVQCPPKNGGLSLQWP